METHVKLEGYIPSAYTKNNAYGLETHVKIEGYTPDFYFYETKNEPETHIKLDDGYTPHSVKNI